MAIWNEVIFVERNAPLSIRTTTQSSCVMIYILVLGAILVEFLTVVEKWGLKKENCPPQCRMVLNVLTTQDISDQCEHSESLSLPELFLHHCWAGILIGLCCEYISWAFWTLSIVQNSKEHSVSQTVRFLPQVRGWQTTL
jgi:hypothetical protein